MGGSGNETGRGGDEWAGVEAGVTKMEWASLVKKLQI